MGERIEGETGNVCVAGYKGGRVYYLKFFALLV